jgi:enoyl-CoA hydratase/carnithine racemase
MDLEMWQELPKALAWLDATPEARVGVLSGAGKHFTAGIDLSLLAGLGNAVRDRCEGRTREKLRLKILELQACISSLERCRKPVLAAIHGACLGAGVDLVTACDLRYCSADASFCVKEIDLGMTADVGTLQRLPRLVGEGLARELAYTGRAVSGTEAQEIRLVNRCHATREELATAVHEIARTIAAKSPLAVRGCKEMITYVRDHPTADALNYVATWNAAMLLSDDLGEGVGAALERRPPRFAD